ncbi:MAG: hypothetical protein WA790_17600 [Sulfitobacter sp.]
MDGQVIDKPIQDGHEISTSVLTDADAKLVAQVTLNPKVTIRSATSGELDRAAAWQSVMDLNGTEIDVAIYRDGSTTHAPEVIKAYLDISPALPQDFVLIYAHRGVQIDAIHPLLASLHAYTNHQGKSYALRQKHKTDVTALLRFARAVTPVGACALVLDDHQIRIGPKGTLSGAPIQFSTFHNTDLHSGPRSGDVR